MEKIVSQLTPDGFYVGPAIADMSPLEPGVFLMPGGAIDIAPPDRQEPGKRYRLEDGRWTALDIPGFDSSRETGLPSEEHQDLAARARRDVLLEHAGLRMAPLQDAVDLGIATNAEQESLTAWKTYRVHLNRVPDQAGYPAAIDWPIEPA
ncbi:tail fiber assembly protein [Achromobacter ruhlandii]|uniref:tail fiber assembly protein n=1 Tax=Achromobacter ruhlandii TaxID=72557 RepID=UPI000B15A716|nr:tail fiber assembly protein [Achromobacter ruhlandii]